MIIDPYLYKDCEVLKNKLGIKDSSELDQAEVDFSCNAIYELTVSPLAENYDFKHFELFMLTYFLKMYMNGRHNFHMPICG